MPHSAKTLAPRNYVRVKRRRSAYDRQYRNIRLKVLKRDPICTIQKNCSGAPSTTADHRIPVSQGGESTEENMRGACISCNSSAAHFRRVKR